VDRGLYFEKIISTNSPLVLLTQQVDKLIQVRTNDLNESINSYLAFADQLEQQPNAAAKRRAEFIRMQCNKQDTKLFFEQHRESWGIPIFEEGLLTVDDFKNGFLWTFRDHSTSWCEDGEARDWFFKNIEARFARHYQFWACDNGFDEILLSTSGEYKAIMWTIIKEYQDYSALASSVFTKQELTDFFNSFNEKTGDYDKEDLLEMIEENPNW
jgi:uncharacterized protein (TIGR02996 family)